MMGAVLFGGSRTMSVRCSLCFSLSHHPRRSSSSNKLAPIYFLLLLPNSQPLSDFAHCAGPAKQFCSIGMPKLEGEGETARDDENEPNDYSEEEETQTEREKRKGKETRERARGVPGRTGVRLPSKEAGGKGGRALEEPSVCSVRIGGRGRHF